MDIGTILALVFTILGFSLFGIVAAGGEGGGQASGSGDSAPPAGTPPAASGSPPASAAGNSSDGGSLPSAAGGDGNIRQLREAYENLKREHEPYTKLGKAEEISGNVSLAAKITKAAIDTGAALGYREDEIRASLAEDPDGTLAFLRQKQAEAAANTDPLKRAEQLLDKRLKPIEESLAQEREAKLVNEAHNRFNTAFDEGIKSLFGDEKLSDKELDGLYEGALRLLRSDPEAVARLREGKTSDVAKYLTQARQFFDEMHLARTERESKRTGTPPQRGTASQEEKNPNLLSDLAAGKFPKSGPLSKYA